MKSEKSLSEEMFKKKLLLDLNESIHEKITGTLEEHLVATKQNNGRLLLFSEGREQGLKDALEIIWYSLSESKSSINDS